jgi:hypothetical protein
MHAAHTARPSKSPWEPLKLGNLTEAATEVPFARKRPCGRYGPLSNYAARHLAPTARPNLMDEMPTFEEVLTDAPQRARNTPVSGVYPLGSHMSALLGQSGLWHKFVSDFDPKLFRLSGVPRLALKGDPNLQKPFYCWITKQRSERLFSGGTYGERDLTESAEKVRKRQPVTKRRILRLPKTRGVRNWREDCKASFQSSQICHRSPA